MPDDRRERGEISEGVSLGKERSEMFIHWQRNEATEFGRTLIYFSNLWLSLELVRI